MPRQTLVVMGTAGAGKTVVGTALADALAIPFVEGDSFHPPENVAKMASGTPLSDDDRQPWLVALAAQLRAARAANAGIVLSCSALKRRYRDTLRDGDKSVRFIFLRGTPSLLRERLDARTGHYMPPSLLASQFAALEPPAADEHAWTVDVTTTPEAIVADLVERLRTADAAARP